METIFGLHLASVYSAVSNATVLAQSDDNSSHTSWPEAMFIAAAIVSGCSIAAILIWQIFLTARKAIEKNQDTQIQEELQTITQRAIASNEAAAKELAQLSQSDRKESGHADSGRTANHHATRDCIKRSCR